MPADIDKTIKGIPVIVIVIEVDVAPVITSVSTDSEIVFIGSYFLYFCLHL